MDKEITFQFKKDPGYRLVVANGAWGGLTPRGEVKFDLFFEHIDLPDEITYMSTPDGLGPETERAPFPAPIKRDTLVGIVMTVENAENFARWLLEKVQQYRKKDENPENKAVT
ncbi:MAG: hypothetical protein HKM06_08295 [Spirochaetales bacterium]|nr:hypothetical protein [Spirochaetales bacterium]